MIRFGIVRLLLLYVPRSVSGLKRFLQELVSQEERFESESLSCGEAEVDLPRSGFSTSSVWSPGWELINLAMSSSTSGMLSAKTNIYYYVT